MPVDRAKDTFMAFGIIAFGLGLSSRCGSRGICAALAAIALAMVSLAPSAADAQTPYRVQHSTTMYTSFSGGTAHVPVAYSAFTNWDEGAAAISLPFAFDWFGRDYTTVYVYTNGFLSFSPPPQGVSLLTAPSMVPAPNNPINNYIGVLWGDLDAGASPSIRSRVTGMSGARVVEIQVEGLVASNNTANSAASFQVWLREGTNQVDINYGPNFGLSSLAAVIENDDGTDGANLMALSPTCDMTCACGPRLCASANFQPGKRITIRPPDAAELNATITTPNGAFPGATFEVEVALRNVGLAAAGAFRYEVLLTPSNTSTAGSTQLTSVNVPSLGPTTALTSTLALTLPAMTPVGTFFVAVVVDPADAVVEAIESNNVAYSGPFTTGPDLQATLAVPAETGPLETLPVQVELQSAGAPVVDPFEMAFFLSTTPARGAGAISLGTRSLTLPDGFMLSQTIGLTVPVNTPLSPPPYFVVAEIDNPDVVVEVDENNNSPASPTTVLVRAPELEVPRFEAGPFGFRGEAYPTTVTIRNDGGAAARDFSVCVLLSDNVVISVTTDRTVLQTAPLTLPAGEQLELRLEPTIPTDIAPGPWFVAAVADCQETVTEGDEADNINRRVDPITVRDVAPDFVPLAVDTASASAAGETLPLAVRVANIGSATGDVRVRVALSLNPGITGSDPTIFETSSPVSLAPPMEASVTGWGQIESTLPSGRYFVGVVVDPTDAIDEVFEDNNVLVGDSIDISGSGLAIVTPAPPNAVTGVDYVRRFDAVGGSAPYAWSFTWTGEAPDGLSFDPATAQLAGVPTTSDIGAYEFTVEVVSGALTAIRDYRLIISPPTFPLTVVSSRLPPAVAGESYSVLVIAVGGEPPYTWGLTSQPPFGVSLLASGLLGGEPQIPGANVLDVEVVDALGRRATGTLVFDILDPSASLTITTADLPDGLVGTEYVGELRAEGGAGPLEWAVEGQTPPGLDFGFGETVLITGTPTVAGDYPLIFEVRDQAGLIDRNAFIFEIIEEGALTIITGQNREPGLPTAIVNRPYVNEDGSTVRLQAVPATDVTWSILSGGLPDGLVLQSDGRIEGTPTEVGAFAFLVLATNSANDIRRGTLALVVQEPGRVFAEDGCSCRASAPRTGRTGSMLGLLLVVLIGWRWGRRRGRR